MPVLAMLAMEVAANAAQGVRERTRQVMEERFFLDGIYCFSADLPIRSGIQGSLFVQPHTADPVAAFLYGTAVVAE